MSENDRNNVTDLARREQPQALQEYDGLRMMMSPAEALKRLEELRAFVKAVMRPGINNDYAVIPGTNKPTLLQPGAQKLAEIYGLAVSFVDVEDLRDWDRPLFFFRKRCVLTSRRDGRFICDGIGSCNSREDRYSGRWVNEEELHAGLTKEHLKTKTRDTKRGKWTQYRIPNDDIFSLVNTIEKMACKRALIHAVLNATRSADIFSQDLEHISVDDEAIGLADETRSWATADSRSEAERVREFEELLDAAQNASEINRLAADIAKSDLPMSAGGPLRKRVTDRLTVLRQGTKPKLQPTKKAAADPELPRGDVDEHGYSTTGDPEPPRRDRRPGEE